MRDSIAGRGWAAWGALCQRLFALCLGLAALAAAGMPAWAQGEGSVALRRIIPDEKLQRPLQLVPLPDGSGEMLVLEQHGLVKRFSPAASRAAGVFLDIRGRVSRAGNEEGLLSLAFHPQFSRNGWFYVYYSAAGPRRSVISRFQAGSGGKRGLSGSERVVLEVRQPFSNHNGGQMAFGPDGMLYIALGDGGSGGDPLGNAQNLGTLLGAILRIDVNRSAAGRQYAIPPDNPFAGRSGARGEIWAYGLRNPWRFSFDRETGALWVADVGQNAVEEVNRIRKGGNYGWNLMEGSRCYDPPEGCRREGLEPPLTEYTHGPLLGLLAKPGRHGQSISGGFVYRGRAIPALRGRYVFGDYVSGTVWSIPADTTALTEPETLLLTEHRISSFGEDGEGELYLVDHAGALYRLIPNR